MKRGEPGGTDRENSKNRGRARRGRERGGRGNQHKTVYCPGCGGNIPYIEGVHSAPVICGGCEYRLRCESCGGDIASSSERYETDEQGRRVGDPDPDPDLCPRCGKPADGSDPAMTPEDESFTWGEE